MSHSTTHQDTAPAGLGASLPASGRDQAMDWALLCASQDIPCTIIEQENVWCVTIPPEEQGRARAALDRYLLENAAWPPPPPPAPRVTFHPAVLLWAASLAWVFWVATNRNPAIRDAGSFNTLQVATGEWWRSFTSTTLHADLPHLVANLASGLLLVGLAMGLCGAGFTLLACVLAGAAGNLTGLATHAGPYVGLGASGMVMGSLGFIAGAGVSRPAAGITLRRRLGTVVAGLFLFVLLGLDARSDVPAHAGGLAFGILSGFLFGCVDAFRWKDRLPDALAGLAALGLLLGAWWRAIG